MLQHIYAMSTSVIQPWIRRPWTLTRWQQQLIFEVTAKKQIMILSFNPYAVMIKIKIKVQRSGWRGLGFWTLHFGIWVKAHVSLAFRCFSGDILVFCCWRFGALGFRSEDSSVEGIDLTRRKALRFKGPGLHVIAVLVSGLGLQIWARHELEVDSELKEWKNTRK